MENTNSKNTTYKYLKVGFEYRCGGNYSTCFTKTYDFESEHIETLNYSGREITMGECDTPTQEEFFNSEIHEFEYDQKYDHDILRVVSLETTNTYE